MKTALFVKTTNNFSCILFRSGLWTKLRIIATENQRNRNHGRKVDFAHILSVWRLRHVTEGNKVSFFEIFNKRLSNKKLNIYRKSNLSFRYDEDFSRISSITLDIKKTPTNSISFMQLLA